MKTATVVKDCTGTYVCFAGNNADYLVYNPATLAAHPSGSTVNVTFRSAGRCSLPKEPTCRMFHESKGNLTILKV
ncbi:hypothetical protein [Chryseobacterium sp. MFBS3-17]|uniref:hypothetical protein n=1 Tax=Chryseobacterium sp. MFBS3-17 TaxID=2886689 RepID=UPI001D0EED69|nr:hypothetical protein [Chryseobacterium sp. MFBS3-17]MCC2589763.1 hypothetical protein [Chryseobacterium sp. MFBS3-17]